MNSEYRLEHLETLGQGARFGDSRAMVWIEGRIARAWPTPVIPPLTGSFDWVLAAWRIIRTRVSRNLVKGKLNG
jgi:hypothetical protein